MNWYWGDLHCHTNLSYGRGTMQRAYEIARTHLDFCTVTGHAYWPDMPEDLQQYDSTIMMHLGGFAKCHKYWPSYLRITDQYNSSELVTFPSYEWHSDRYGDYNVYSKSSQLELIQSQSVQEFAKHLSAGDHIIAPHHTGYTENNRGIDWQAFRDSPLRAFVEVYSNHGCAMSEEAPFDYYHSMGPRDGRRTVHYGLGQGLKFGFIASTDGHDGFPGHYSHGRVGVLAEAKSRSAIWQGLLDRRTVAVTGARIIADFRINDAPLGSEIATNKSKRDIYFDLHGNQPFRLVELIENGRITFRSSPILLDQDDPEGVYYIKLEWGWGQKEQSYSWQNDLQIHDGELLGFEPCFRHSMFDTDSSAPPHQIVEQTERRITWTSQTRGVPDSIVHNPRMMTSGVNALILKVKATDQTSFVFKSNLLELSPDFEQLRNTSMVKHAWGHESPAVRFNRAYASAACRCQGRIAATAQTEEDFYYVWASQIDDESIWVTPIWVRS